MKNSYAWLYLLFFSLSISMTYAQKYPDLDSSPADISYLRDKSKLPLVKVIYSRPQKKGRTIFGELEPYGKVWRTGANEATEIKFFKDAKFGGKDIKAGTYSLFTIPEKDQWTIILNSELDTWGAYSYKPEKDILRVVVKPITAHAAIEALTIFFKDTEQGGDLIIAWDKTQVEVPIVIAK